jgi:hypothetical protein
VHHFDDLRALVVDQVEQFGAQARVALWRDVVFAACRQRRQRQRFIFWRVGFLGKGFAHGAKKKIKPRLFIRTRDDGETAGEAV